MMMNVHKKFQDPSDYITIHCLGNMSVSTQFLSNLTIVVEKYQGKKINLVAQPTIIIQRENTVHA